MGSSRPQGDETAQQMDVEKSLDDAAGDWNSGVLTISVDEDFYRSTSINKQMVHVLHLHRILGTHEMWYFYRNWIFLNDYC